MRDVNYTYCSWKYSLIYKLSQYKLNSFFRFNDVISSVFNMQKVHIYYLKKNANETSYHNFKLILKHWDIILTHSYALRKAAFIFSAIVHTHKLWFGIKQQCFLCNCDKVKRNLYNKKIQKILNSLSEKFSDSKWLYSSQKGKLVTEAD